MLKICPARHFSIRNHPLFFFFFLRSILLFVHLLPLPILFACEHSFEDIFNHQWWHFSETGESVLTIEAPNGRQRINRAVWGPLNRTVISAGEDAVIRIWDSEVSNSIQRHSVVYKQFWLTENVVLVFKIYFYYIVPLLSCFFVCLTCVFILGCTKRELFWAMAALDRRQ